MSSVLQGPSDNSLLQTPPQVKQAVAGIGARAGWRRFGDPPAIRQRLFDNALNTASMLEPVSNDRYTLKISKVAYDGPDKVSIPDQKTAVMAGDSLGRRLRGTWDLVDNTTGKTVSSKRTTLATIPYFTGRGTFVNNGNEYTLSHQMRLRSGVYAREKDNGEFEAHVNVLPGKGASHRIYLDPETGVFRLQLGQARIPLISVLRAMGAKDNQLRDAWGNDLTAVNMQKANPADVNKLYARLVRGGKDEDPSVRTKAIVNALQKMELDPKVTQRTLGTAFKNVSLDSIFTTTRKLLAIRHRKDPAQLKKLKLAAMDPDNRDSLVFMRMHGPEDLISERVAKSAGLLRQLLWKATARGNVDHIYPGVFDKAVQAALISSGLGNLSESINPAQLYEQQIRVTRMGEGGIPGMDSIPESARNVQPSHFGFIDPLLTPESSRAGVDLRLARNTMKGTDGQIYTQVRTKKDGKLVWRTPDELADSVIAFPGSLSKGGPVVPAMVGSKTKFVPRRSVEYELPHFENTMSAMSNMVPMKSAMKGQRVAMAARMLTQALPLDGGEAPLVQSGAPGEGGSFEDLYGVKMGAIRAHHSGRVVRVTKDAMHVQYADGEKDKIELYNNFPFNRKTYYHQTPTVAAGQTFRQGDLLAHSNYTNAKGVTALGLNTRIMYIPFRGLNFEDAVVVSQSYADRLKSQHMYQHKAELEKDVDRLGKKTFISLFPAEYNREQLQGLDDNGVAQIGQTVEYGDPLVLVTRRQERTANQVHRGRKPTYNNSAIAWKHHSTGVVTDVHRTDKRVVVAVKTAVPTKVGDKLSGRYGDKGVISEIISDDEMPHDADGRPAELLLNPLGIISRTNPAQIIEAALGKIAARTGKTYKIEDFKDIENLTEYALNELTKHGMSDLETIVDPTTGRKISDVLVGNRFIMKLHHTAESKGSGRSIGSYTMEGTPAKGGEEGSKRIGMLDLNALLSHGATDVIRDAHLIRGQRNPEFWSAYMSGFKPATPKVPFVYQKFIHQLQASGINPVRRGDRINIMAMTDKDITKLAGDREIQNHDTVDWKAGLSPRKGGLFDETLTGGHNGNRWSYIQLSEPMPNPVMEEPTRILLGLTKPEFLKILQGEANFQGTTGPAAIGQGLAAINIDRELDKARADIKSGRKALRNAAVKRLSYLKSAKKTGIHPREWMLSKAPVLPPAFRPVSTMKGMGVPLVSDSNYLYRELFDANQNLNKMSKRVADVGHERLAVYTAFKAVAGLGDPLSEELKEKKVRGILKHVFGTAPKYGVVQRRLLGATTDVVGRAVITPNPNLDMDQVGIPENKAWEVYRPFVVRYLVRRGMARINAARAVQDRSEIAKNALLSVMNDRPVVINRAPVLHRYGMMAAFPRIVKGDTMQVSPLVVGGFGADFDGDTMQYHVPVSEEAKKEAVDKMLPSRNLLAAADFKVQFKPSQEYVGGLHAASTRVDRKRPPRSFATKEDAVRAYRRGEIDVGQRIVIVE